MSIESSLDRLTDAVEGLARKVIRMEGKMDAESRDRAVLADRVGNLAIVMVEMCAEARSLREIIEEEAKARRGLGVTVLEHEHRLASIPRGGNGGGRGRPGR